MLVMYVIMLIFVQFLLFIIFHVVCCFIECLVNKTFLPLCFY